MVKAIVLVSFGTANLEGLKVLEDFENEISVTCLNCKLHLFRVWLLVLDLNQRPFG